MKIEIVLPTSERIVYTPRSTVRAGNLALFLARRHGLSTKSSDRRKPTWYFRGPLGEIHPGMMMRDVQLMVGESLQLEARTGAHDSEAPAVSEKAGKTLSAHDSEATP